ncbi:hypothetical protein Tco_1470202 [Tanacetum coccineum]
MNQSPLGELHETSNSTDLSKMWTVMMEREIDTYMEIVRNFFPLLENSKQGTSRSRVGVEEEPYAKDQRGTDDDL